MNRSVSFDYQENTIHFGVALDGMYKGERLGSMLGADITQCVRKTTIRTSPRRASSPLSVTNLGPQSPVEILTMFPLDAFEEDENDAAISKRLLHPTVLEHENEDDASEISEGGHEEVVNEEEHKEFSDEAQTSPPEQTFSPPVYTGKYIPPHLRKREVSSNTKDNCASVGRWVPPHQREGHVNRRSIDASTSLSADSLTTIATLKIKESLSQLRFEDNNSFTTGDDVHGVTSLVGVRKSMEDVCCCIPNLNMHLGHEYFHRQSIYAIFDGHCGVRAATFSSERLLPYLMEHEAFLTDARTAFEDCFRRIDKEFLHQAALEKMSDGTTAAVVLIRGNRLLSANIGDSRAVVSISGIALDVIREQTPGREDERARIERQGGWVKEERELQMSKLHSMDLSDPMIKRKAERVVRWVNIYRVNGELAVSRAIGDFDYKGEALLNYEFWAFPEGHDRTFHGDLIIPVPEFQEIEITPEVEFLIIGCDGLWDTITSQEAVDHIRQKLNEGYNAQVSFEEFATSSVLIDK
jgi:serine/threonine protein phosphatase PrpC